MPGKFTFRWDIPALGGLVTLVGGGVAWAIISLPPAHSLYPLVKEQMPQSGVRAEVTAVLLNFRGYDTLLEMAVLLTAMLGVWQSGPVGRHRTGIQPTTVLETLLRLLVPAIILVSGYLLWLGGHAAGGAFQAGAMLAGAGVMLVVAGSAPPSLSDSILLRLLLLLGTAVFLLVAGSVTLWGRALLEYPRAQAGILILLIEAACTLSIGSILALLFIGGRPPGRGGR